MRCDVGRCQRERLPCPPMHDALVESLQRPEAYPWRPATVEAIETHISWVFLAGDFVVKVKRPVWFPFVDHRTVEQRRHSCEEEVRLNRRLTTDVYLDVVPIMRSGAGFDVDGSGDPVEWATLMRRLPADRMLDAMIAAERRPDHLADRLASSAHPVPPRDRRPCGEEGLGRARRSTAVVTDNLDELRPFAGHLLGSTQLALIDRSIARLCQGHRTPVCSAASPMAGSATATAISAPSTFASNRRGPDLRLRRVQPRRFAARTSPATSRSC